MYLVTAEEMRKMDRMTIEDFGIPGQVLMENAGRGATRFLFELCPELAEKNVGVMAGRGNNGGDGYVIARYLANKNVSVTVYLLADRSRVGGDAAANLDLLGPMGVPVIEVPDAENLAAFKPAMRSKDLWIDAILGTGLNSDVKGFYKEIIDFVNSLNKPVFAVDIASGLNSDSGQPCGTCIKAFATATFAFAKTGHWLYPGAKHTGKLKVVDIGIPRHIVEDVRPKQNLLTAARIGRYFKPRPPDTHKGRTGHLLVIAGSRGKTGAAAMTAMSAVRSGAGLVTLGIPASLNPILESQILEAMTVALPETESGAMRELSAETILELLDGKRCLAFGPGLGQAPETKNLILQLLEQSDVPLVIDADGLNNLAGETKALKGCRVPVVLTPHPGEMARLAETTVGAVQNDRIACARKFADRFKVHVVLKGANTVIAHPDGRVLVNTTGNSGMASGGMGDVLTGLIAGLLTQGFSPEAASHAGVYLHGAAADTLAEKTGAVGYLASEVMDGIPAEIKKLSQTKKITSFQL